MIVTLLQTNSVQAAKKDISSVYETRKVMMSDTQAHHRQKKQALKPEKWFFWRNNKEVEVSNAEQTYGEKWIKTDKQQIHFQALYHDKQFLLDFQPADLKILGKKTNWETRSILFPQTVLEKLERSKTKGSFLGYETYHYQGIVAGINYQVDWIPQLELPARIIKTVANNKTVIKLKEVYSLSETPYKQFDTDKYDDMDYADIGDNESHPIVSQLQKNSGIAYFHQH